MQSEHLERGSRKIEILHLEATLQLKPATVRFAGLPRFLRLSSWLCPLRLLLSSLTEERKNRGNTLRLNKLLEYGNFGGTICLDLSDQLKNAILK